VLLKEETHAALTRRVDAQNMAEFVVDVRVVETRVCFVI
jgi:hypothetical protein